MNIRFFLIACLLTVCISSQAQQVGVWKTYLACYTTNRVAETDNYVYAVADGTLYRYGKDDNSITFYSIQNGLSDTDVKLISYNTAAKKLLIIYDNSNIDLMDEEGYVSNIPSLKNAGNVQNKAVYSVYFKDQEAYLATGFGIWVFRMDNKDVIGTYPINVTYGVTIRGESIYASTNAGIRKAAVNSNLLDPNNWATIPTVSSDFETQYIRELCLFENNICFRADKSGVYYLNANDEVQTLLKKSDLTGMKLEAGYLIPHTASTIYLYEKIGSYETKNFGVVNDIVTLKNNGTFWIASGENGLMGVKRKAANQYEVVVSDLNTDGPKRNWCANMSMHNGKLLVVGGGYNPSSRFYNQPTLMVYENDKWFNFNEKDIYQKAGYVWDLVGVAVDPNDENHYFAASFGEGILEFKDNQFVQLYNHKNSSLQSIYPTQSSAPNYVRVGGIAFDKAGNLWATNCDQVQKGISKRTPDGQWEAFAFPGLNTSYVVDKILITSKGHKWVNVPRSRTAPGILIFDDEGNSHFESTFNSNSQTTIRSKSCYSMAEDQNGEIWLGTTQGPIVCSAPGNAISNPERLIFKHIIREYEEDGETKPFVFLENEQINAIAVDGGNRKWLGTSGSGVYVVSADGSETIHHFTAENSDLYSNTIQSIVINDKTGEVFIGTDKGLISYQSEATEPSASYSDVYAYPNPVRPDFDDQVVITGLMLDSNVKITDLSGHLIYQGKSAGGQIVWNCRNRSGDRVATGIYLVLSSTKEAKESVVTKIAVVK